MKIYVPEYRAFLDTEIWVELKILCGDKGVMQWGQIEEGIIYSRYMIRCCPALPQSPGCV